MEFGIIAPLFILLVFGIVDFGYMINRNTLATNVTRDGARVASLDGPYSQIALTICNGLVDQGIGGYSGTDSTTGAAGSKQANCIATSVGRAAEPDKGKVAVHIGCEECGTSNATQTTYDTKAASGDWVEIEVVYKHSWLTPVGAVCSLFGDRCAGNTILLKQKTRMVRE